MPDLFFPQLTTGCLVQYPVKRAKSVHTVMNEMEDGSTLLSSDSDGSLLTWSLTYAGITTAEVTALQNLFVASCGRLRAFTFCDPLDNLLSTNWLYSPAIQVNGTTFSNLGSSPATLSQTFPLPANYQFCFSLIANTVQSAAGSIVLIRRGPSLESRDVLPIGGSVVSAGNLGDTGVGFTVGIELQPGQTVDLTSIQLEIQSAPSLYREPKAAGGVYTNAHWGGDELLFVSTGPDSFSVSFQIEARV